MLLRNHDSKIYRYRVYTLTAQCVNVLRSYLEGVTTEESFTRFARDRAEITRQRLVAAHHADLVRRLRARHVILG